MPSEDVELTTCGNIPQTDGVVTSHPTADSVPTPSCEGAAIGTKRHTGDPRGMPVERAAFVTCGYIPETDAGVPTPAYEGRTIGTKRYTED